MKNHKKHPGTLSSGGIGILYASKNPEYPEEPLYSIRVLSHNKKSQFFDSEFWRELSSNPFKPTSIPNYYGSFIEDSGDIYILCDYNPKSITTFIEENLNIRQIPILQIHCFYENLVKALAFLQSYQITHEGLTTENIFVNNNNTCHVDITNFNKEKEFENSSLIAQFSNLQNKEKCALNPYKFNVFSLGLLLLALMTKKSSISMFESFLMGENFEKWVNEQISIIEQKSNAKITFFEIKIKLRLMEKIKQCLNLNEEKRPDFIDLFWLNTKEHSEKLRRHILLDDELMNPKSFANFFYFSENYFGNESEERLPSVINKEIEDSKITYRKEYINDIFLNTFEGLGNIKKYNKVLQPFNQIEIET